MEPNTDAPSFPSDYGDRHRRSPEGLGRDGSSEQAHCELASAPLESAALVGGRPGCCDGRESFDNAVGGLPVDTSDGLLVPGGALRSLGNPIIIEDGRQ